MASFNAIEISDILATGQRQHINIAPEATVTKFAIDSRSVTDPDSTLFFAISTGNNDGHRYIGELYRRGVRNFVVNTVPDGFPEANFYRVDDTVAALQKLASVWRDRLKFPIIAVTGSRGKTEVKEWIYSILKSNGIKGQRSPRSFNSQIGVALSLLSLENKGDFAVIEAGISQPGEMERIEKMVRPDIGVLTNITAEHDEGFRSRIEKINEKLKLFPGVKKLIYARDSADTELNNLIANVIGSDRLIVSCDTCDGNHDKLNATTALTAASLIAPGIKADNFQKIATRIEVEKGLNNCMILHDRFTNDLESLEGALDFAARRVTASRSLTLVIDSSKFDNDFNLDSIKKIAGKYNVGRIITVNSVEEFRQNYSPESFSNEIILIKGCPENRFSQIVSLLEAKQHETVLEVNLDNVVHNYNFFRSRLPAESGIIVMLKADGYGCGALELAKTLQSQGAAAIAVAVVDEGVELRKAGITMPVIVLNPRARNSGIMIENRLEPEVYSFELLESIINNVEEQHAVNFPIHIKIDTGMHRLGFDYESLPRLVEILNNTDSVTVSTMFSHLATADCLNMNDYTDFQLDYFKKCVDYMKENLKYPFKAHILNTAGILRYPEHHYDFARLGIGLYGLPVINNGIEDQIKPVAALYSTIIALSTRHTGETVGYGRRGKIDGDRIIATVPIGYADGIDRHLGNGRTSFIVNGHECPTVGNICMDICMIDVTDANAQIGDRVEIFGPHANLCRLSTTLDTIPYEILTSISPRVKRMYYRE